jgi:hypothetical protein
MIIHPRRFGRPAGAVLTAIAALGIVAPTPSFADAPTLVTVRGTGTDLGETPIVVALKESLPTGAYVLKPASGSGDAIPANVFNDSGMIYLGAVLPSVSGSKSVSYKLERSATEESAARGVVLERQGPNVKVSTGGKPLTEYLTDSSPKPYYFPVIGPTGLPITRAYPMQMVEGETRDHPHQRSLWFTHGKVNGVDFWSESTTNGSIKETAKRTVVSGPAVGLIRTTDDWLDHDGKKVCEDERVVRFYDTKTARVLDFDITIRATAGPVTFGDTKEGMFGVRVASSMDVDRKKGGKITNSEGQTNADAWGKPAAWVDYTGPVGDDTVGIAILNHPESFRYPTTWHVRTYGLFAANPFGWHDFGRSEAGDYTIPAGQSISFRYRLIVHKGDTAQADVPTAFRAYTKPPVVEVQTQ